MLLLFLFPPQTHSGQGRLPRTQTLKVTYCIITQSSKRLLSFLRPRVDQINAAIVCFFFKGGGGGVDSEIVDRISVVV